MAVLSLQLVVTMIMASVLSKISPKYSLARWILTSRLVRYLHPTDDELRKLAGISAPGGKAVRGAKRDFKRLKDEPYTVPKSINLQLETATITPTDLLTVKYYTEYHWLVDFALYGIIIYSVTELYYAMFQPDEFNLSMMWCILEMGFALKVMFSLTAMYFRTEDGGERILCIIFGFFFLILAMSVLIVDEQTLEFGLKPGYMNFSDNAQAFLELQGIPSAGPASLLTFRISLAIFSSIIGSFLTFPGLRLAKMYSDAITYASERPFMQTLLHLNIVFPLIIALSWVKPVVRDFIVNSDSVYSGNKLKVEEKTFEAIRICMIFAFCFFRLCLIWQHLQAHLNLAVTRVEEMKKEAGRISAVDIKKLVVRVYFYLCVVTLQYVAPLILLFYFACMLKTMGDCPILDSFGIHLPILRNATASSPASFAGYGSISGPAAQFSMTIFQLRQVFTPVLFKGVFSFLCWWMCTAWFITSAFGMVYYSYFSL